MRQPRVLLIVAVCTLVVGPVAGAKEVKVQYYDVMVDGVRIGWRKDERVVETDKVVTASTMYLTLLRRGRLQGVEELVIHTETPDGKPLEFTDHKVLGPSFNQCRGQVGKKGTVIVTGSSAGSMWETDIEWPEGAMLAEAARKVIQEKGLGEGTEYTVKVFIPLGLQAAEMKVQIGPTKEVDILGQTLSLTEVTQTTATSRGTQKLVSYVDEDWVPRKMILRRFDLKLELVACEKTESTRTTADAATWLTKCALASPVPLSEAAAVKPITYQLDFTSDKKPGIPDTGSQTIRKSGKNAVLVKVLPAAPSAQSTFPYDGQDKVAKRAMKATTYLQSKDNKLVGLARKAVGKATDAAEAARSIEAFVRKYLKKQKMSLDYGKSVDAVTKKQGDCTEFSVLTAAMCRAVGIPARTVCGVAYAKEFGGRKDVFVPHMWVEAFAGGTWLGLDATQEACDARRIALKVGDGRSSDFARALDMLTAIKITKVVLPKKRQGMSR